MHNFGNYFDIVQEPNTLRVFFRKERQVHSKFILMYKKTAIIFLFRKTLYYENEIALPIRKPESP